MIQRNRFEMATHNYEMSWPTSEDRLIHIEKMKLRESGKELVLSLKELAHQLESLSQTTKTFEQIWLRS